MKKKIIAATMAAAMCVSLAACGGSTASSSAAESTASSTAESTASSTADAASTGDEEVDLRMAWWGSQDRHDRTIKAIELYESLHPNVKIEYEYYSFDDYFTKLKTLVASDQVWDIFQLGGNFPMYMDKIYPLDDYIASGVVDVSGIGDANLKTTQDTEGHQLGISNGLNSYGIAYDPDMFAEAGVAEPTDTWTWDDYANAANTIHEKLGIYGCSSMLTSEFIAGCSVYVAQYGDVGQYSFFNLDLTGMGFDDPQMLTPYIQMRADSIKNEVYPDAGASAEITNIENDFLVTGEAAMAWVAANQFPTMYNVCQAIGPQCRFVQQYDPFTGEPSVICEPGQPPQDAYGPAMLSVLEYTARMYGVSLVRDTVVWGTCPLECRYTQALNGRSWEIVNSGHEAEAFVDGRKVFTAGPGLRITTDLDGNILGTARYLPDADPAQVTPQ